MSDEVRAVGVRVKKETSRKKRTSEETKEPKNEKERKKPIKYASKASVVP